jgi:hypothetical protein
MTITDAWKNAELTCFTQLVTALDSKAEYDAFRGYLPEIRDSWMFTSGGIETGPIERFYGESGAWCSMSMKARIEGIFAHRDSCLEFAGKVLQFLQDSGNMHQTGNVMWLRLTDFPQEPQETALTNEQGEVSTIIWRIIIPLEMVFATSAEFPA